MRYESIEELPIHCRLNLPETAQHVYREAWNRAWEMTSDRTAARDRAWSEVRGRFERDALTGRWMPRAQPIPLRAVEAETETQTAASAR
jgi:cation transport regulator ChaB